MMKRALIWKLLERFGVLGVQFILQVILARLLTPEDYGVLSLMVIFTTLANVFIQNGFNTSLIQNKDVTEEDYSSVFWVSLIIAAIIYGGLYIAAPLIAEFYHMPNLVAPFRVLCLMLFPGAYNSVQLAKVSRQMDFKKVFYSNVAGIILAGAVGIGVAKAGGGLWALVIQTILNTLVACVVMSFTVKWYPRLVINFRRVKVLFSYGWKLLVSSLMDTLYQNIQSLMIGKKYNADTLAYYDRGKQFPQYGINAINSAVQSVLLPAMSAEQDDAAKVKSMTRNSVMMSSYIIFPMMAGLAGIASSFVKLLLTDKWLECVPFMQICCISFAFYPVYTSNLQAIKAMGQSGIFLKIEIIKKIVGLVLLVVAVFCFSSPQAIAMTGIISIPVDIIINAYPNKKLIGYSYFEQIKDIVPSFLLSILMFLIVISMERFGFRTELTLVIQIVVGMAVYILISAILKLEPFIKLEKSIANFRK